MKTKNCFFKRAFSFIAAAIILFSCALPVCADQDDVRDAADGVFKINYNWDGSPVSRGTCFLINEDTVITANHCVYDSEAVYAAYREEYGLSKVEINEKYVSHTVVLAGDGGIKATVIYATEANDFAILKLETPIKNRSFLTLRDSTDVERAEEVFSVGFPASKDTNQTFDKNDVAVERGVVNKEQFLYTGYVDQAQYFFNGDFLMYSAGTQSGGNSGGPMVDEDGYVIGVVSFSDQGSCYAAATSKIMSVLDSLDIKYNAAGDNTVLIIVLCVIGGLILVIGIAILIIFLVRKNKTTPPAAPYAYGYNAAPGYNTTVSDSSSTPTTLLSDSEETTILSQEINGGFLIRMRNNESIKIADANFAVGRERKSVRYCVDGNPNISRVHAVFVVNNGTTYIVDNNAVNGTFLNGARLAPGQTAELNNGDQVMLADELFVFQK